MDDHGNCDDPDMGDWGPAAWQQMRNDIEWLKALVTGNQPREKTGPPWIVIVTGCLTPILVAILSTQPWK